MEELYWAEIKTNISNVFFNSDEDNQRFNSWLNASLDSNEWITNTMTFDCPIEGINQIVIIALEITDSNVMDTEIQVDSEFDYDTLISMEDLYSYISDTVVPQFIDAFNTNCQIRFPTTQNGDFKWMMFDNDSFYTKVYFSDSSNSYMNVSVQPNVLYLIPDFELQT